MAELHHGGRLNLAAEQYGIPLNEWLDLSTGINPNGWPVETVSAESWLRLPEPDDGLVEAASDYYDNDNFIPVAGSQVAIQLLPKLRQHSRVGLLKTSYAEHAHAWQKAGHEVVLIDSREIELQLPSLDALILVNPNNPTGEIFTREQLLKWHAELVGRGGWLIVDEAFMDASGEQTLLPSCGEEGLVVLRSLGKFFGLAGARVGFLFAWEKLRQQVNSELGPWPLSGPAREVAQQALRDVSWQQANTLHLQQASRRLTKLLSYAGLAPDGGSELFQYVVTNKADAIHQALAQQGIFTRLFSQPEALRFGLPGSEEEWQRLQQALEHVLSTTMRRAS